MVRGVWYLEFQRAAASIGSIKDPSRVAVFFDERCGFLRQELQFSLMNVAHHTANNGWGTIAMCVSVEPSTCWVPCAGCWDADGRVLVVPIVAQVEQLDGLKASTFGSLALSSKYTQHQEKMTLTEEGLSVLVPSLHPKYMRFGCKSESHVRPSSYTCSSA